MTVFNQGEENEVTLRLVLESEPFGREHLDGHDALDGMLESLKRLVGNCVSAAAEDGIERLVVIAVIPKGEYGDESG